MWEVIFQKLCFVLTPSHALEYKLLGLSAARRETWVTYYWSVYVRHCQWINLTAQRKQRANTSYTCLLLRKFTITPWDLGEDTDEMAVTFKSTICQRFVNIMIIKKMEIIY